MSEEIKGHIIIVMAPMASGKGILISHAMERFPTLKRLVSCTTRAKRPGEVEGNDYFFLSREEFERRVKAREFFEWTEFSENLYGTMKAEITDHLTKGHVVINEMDLTGVRRLLSLLPREHLTVIYVDAGDWDTLVARALSRAPMSEEELTLRRVHYHEEIAFKHKTDFVIQNNDGELERAKEQMAKVVGNIIKKTAS